MTLKEPLGGSEGREMSDWWSWRRVWGWGMWGAGKGEGGLGMRKVRGWRWGRFWDETRCLWEWGERMWGWGRWGAVEGVEEGFEVRGIWRSVGERFGWDWRQRRAGNLLREGVMGSEEWEKDEELWDEGDVGLVKMGRQWSAWVRCDVKEEGKGIRIEVRETWGFRGGNPKSFSSVVRTEEMWGCRGWGKMRN